MDVDANDPDHPHSLLPAPPEVECTILECAEDLSLGEIVEMLRWASLRGVLDVVLLTELVSSEEHPRARAVTAQALEVWRSGDDLLV